MLLAFQNSRVWNWWINPWCFAYNVAIAVQVDGAMATPALNSHYSTIVVGVPKKSINTFAVLLKKLPFY